jgi:hypothetical protein
MTRILLVLVLFCAGAAWFGRMSAVGPSLAHAPSLSELASSSESRELLLSRSAEKVLLEVRESRSVDSLVHASKGAGRIRLQGASRLELNPHLLCLLRGAATRARGLAVAHLEFAALLSAARSGLASFHATGTPPPAPGA